MATTTLAAERFWADKAKFDTAERQYYETLTKEYANNCSAAPQLLPAVAADDVVAANRVIVVGEPRKSPPRRVLFLHKPKPKSQMQATADLATAAIIRDVAEEPKSSSAVVAAKKNKKKNKATAAAKRAAAAAAAPSLSPPSADAAGGGGSVQVGPLLSPAKILDLSLKFNSNSSSSSANVKKNAHVSNAKGTGSNSQCTLVSEIAKAREHIKNSLEKMDGIATLAASPVSGEVLDRIAAVEKDNADLRQLVENLKALTLDSQKRIATLEAQLNKAGAAPTVAAAPAAAATATKKDEPEEDDGVDLFASESDDEESAEAARIREERLAAYAAKKSKKPALIAKSSLVLDIKPWDDETDMKLMETEVRKITSDGLLWGASKLVPVAFGILKISISCVVEDDKVSIDWLTEEIEKIEDYVQSVDVAAFNKI